MHDDVHDALVNTRRAESLAKLLTSRWCGAHAGLLPVRPGLRPSASLCVQNHASDLSSYRIFIGLFYFDMVEGSFVFSRNLYSRCVKCVHGAVSKENMR